MSKPKLLILEGKNGPRITAYCDGPAVNEVFEVVRSESIVGRPDLIYCQTYGQRNSFDQLRAWRGKYVLHVGGDIWDERRERKGGETLPEITRVMKRAQKVICVSRFLAGIIKDNLGGHGNVISLPGGLWGTDHTSKGIDPSKFKPKTNWKINGRPLVVMNIGLTVRRKWKGVPVFMTAAHKVLREYDALVVCVGKVGGNRGMSERWNSAWGLQMVPPSLRWPEFLRQADLYVHPSMFDGFPRSVAEVCCVGLPALLFDVAGIPEVSESAVLVNPKNEETIARQVRELLCSEKRRARLGQEMRREALEKTEAHRGDYAKMLLDVLEA